MLELFYSPKKEAPRQNRSALLKFLSPDDYFAIGFFGAFFEAFFAFLAINLLLLWFVARARRAYYLANHAP